MARVIMGAGGGNGYRGVVAENFVICSCNHDPYRHATGFVVASISPSIYGGRKVCDCSVSQFNKGSTLVYQNGGAAVLVNSVVSVRNRSCDIRRC